MKLIEHTAVRRRVLSGFLCLGISVNPIAALADTKGVQEPPRSTGSHDVAAATKTGGTANNTAKTRLAAATPERKIIATVNGNPIYLSEFNARYAAIMRERYYHGKPPEGAEDAVRKEVTNFLIEDELLAEEAERRGFKPDEARIKEIAAQMEARYGSRPEWKRDREDALYWMKRQVGRPGLIEQARKALREIPQPTPAQVRVYYENNPKLFTEPGKQRLSMILLDVDPGAPNADWEGRRKEAQELYFRLKDGADFAELARQYSGDKSATSGGDLGFLHGGMLEEKLQNILDKLELGAVSEPNRVLQGFVIYRLDERIAPMLREFTDVESRAQELLKRDLENQAWEENISRLRGDAKIEIFAPITK